MTTGRIDDPPSGLRGHREPSYRPHTVRYTVVCRACGNLVDKDELAEARVRVGGLVDLYHSKIGSGLHRQEMVRDMV